MGMRFQLVQISNMTFIQQQAIALMELVRAYDPQTVAKFLDHKRVVALPPQLYLIADAALIVHIVSISTGNYGF